VPDRDDEGTREKSRRERRIRGRGMKGLEGIAGYAVYKYPFDYAESSRVVIG